LGREGRRIVYYFVYLVIFFSHANLQSSVGKIT